MPDSQVSHLEDYEGSPESIEVSGPQRRLYEALADHSRELCSMYRGAIQVLNSTSIADRFAMAAHNLRELMKELPGYIDVRINGDFSLKKAINDLDEQWEAVKQNSNGFHGEAWDGEIDADLVEYFEEMEEIFITNKKYNLRRRERYSKMLRRLNPSGTPISEHTKRRLFTEWKETREFFLAVCHHGKKTDINEFNRYLDLLENHILARLRPATFEKQEELDQIIAEAEVDD